MVTTTITSGLTPRQVRALQLTLERERRRLVAAARRFAKEEGAAVGHTTEAIDTAALRRSAEAALDDLADRTVLAGPGGARTPTNQDRPDQMAAAAERLRGTLAALDRLEAVERALRQIHAQSYGVCERCGRPIAFPRLVLLPWTRLCHRCERVPWKGSARGAAPATIPAAVPDEGEPLSSIWWFSPPEATRELPGEARVPTAAGR
jgi:RNA polymerase-binding transcription factor DksA